MKKIVFILLLLSGVSASLLYGQERDLRLKLSTRYNIDVNPIINPQTGQAISNNVLSGPQIGLLVPTSNGDFLEFGVSRFGVGHALDFQRNVPGMGAQFVFDFMGNFQYNLTTRDHWDKLKLYLGMGAYVGANRGQLIAPSQPTIQSTRIQFQTQLGLRIAPGMMYDLSEQYFLNIAVPMNFLPFRYTQAVHILSNGTTEFVRSSDLGLFPESIPLELGFGIRF